MRQESCGIANFFWLPPAFDASIFIVSSTQASGNCALRHQLMKHARIDHADQDRVGADAVPPFLARDALQPAFVRRLGRNRQPVAIRPAEMPG